MRAMKVKTEEGDEMQQEELKMADLEREQEELEGRMIWVVGLRLRLLGSCESMTCPVQFMTIELDCRDRFYEVDLDAMLCPRCGQWVEWSVKEDERGGSRHPR